MSAFFTKYPWLWIILISMVPVVELRGAIPTGFFGYDLPIVQVCIISAIANLVPVPIIYFFARKVLVWGKDKKVIGKFFTFCLEKGEKGGKKLSGKTGIGLFIGLALFVGIPLPGTGAWTGTLVASLLDIKFKRAFPAICCGVICAAVVVGFICAGGSSAFSWLIPNITKA